MKYILMLYYRQNHILFYDLTIVFDMLRFPFLNHRVKYMDENVHRVTYRDENVHIVTYRDENVHIL